MTETNPQTIPEDGAVRDGVSRAYAAALKNAETQSASACCAPSAMPGHEAGRYGGESEAFSEAKQASFGCGNPLAFAGVQPGQTVLDLGSGAGLDLLIAAEKVGPTGRVIGVDMTDDMIEAARRNVAKAGLEEVVEVRKGIIEKLPVEDGSVDWVISNCVINLSPDKAAVFREIARVLRPGGRFSVADIVVEELPAWLMEHEAAYAACVTGAIPEADYVGGLRDAGLDGVEVTERYVYDESQLESLIAHDLASFELDRDLIERGLGDVAGKVASVKVVGRRA